MSGERFLEQLLDPIIAEARRLEELAGAPAGTATVRWEQDERGWPVKAVVSIPTAVTESVPATETPPPPVPRKER